MRQIIAVVLLILASASSAAITCTESLSAVDLADIAWLNSTDEVAHGGGLNACGCHFNRRTNECHCHQPRGCGCACQPFNC